MNGPKDERKDGCSGNVGGIVKQQKTMKCRHLKSSRIYKKRITKSDTIENQYNLFICMDLTLKSRKTMVQKVY